MTHRINSFDLLQHKHPDQVLSGSDIGPCHEPISQNATEAQGKAKAKAKPQAQAEDQAPRQQERDARPNSQHLALSNIPANLAQLSSAIRLCVSSPPSLFSHHPHSFSCAPCHLCHLLTEPLSQQPIPCSTPTNIHSFATQGDGDLAAAAGAYKV